MWGKTTRGPDPHVLGGWRNLLARKRMRMIFSFLQSVKVSASKFGVKTDAFSSFDIWYSSFQICL